MSKDTKKVSLYNRCLNGIERVGNSLPNPIALFAIFALAIIVISLVFYSAAFTSPILKCGKKARRYAPCLLLCKEMQGKKRKNSKCFQPKYKWPRIFVDRGKFA